MEFFQEAPAGAIVLVVLGAVLWIVVGTPLRIATARRMQAEKKLADETGLPPMVREDSGISTILLVEGAGWALMIGGFAWYIFG